MMEIYKFIATTIPDCTVIVQTEVQVKGTVFATNEEEASDIACKDVIDMFCKKRKISKFKIEKI